MNSVKNKLRIILLGVFAFIMNTVLAAGGGNDNSPYFNLSAPFVVNLQGDSGLAFLQVNAQFKVKKPEFKAKLSEHMPAIQHTMMMVLSEQTQNEVRSVAGKEKLRGEALKQVQALLKEQLGDEAIEEIYFTGFIIQ